jgi:hypothetical protein
MPKPHHKTAAPEFQAQFDRWKLDTRLDTARGFVNSPAVGVLRMVEAIFARGFDITPDEIPTPAHDRLAEYQGDLAGLAQLRLALGVELDLERRAKHMAESRRGWAAAPSEAELAEQRRLERVKVAQEAALEQRTAGLAESAEAKRLAGVRAKAREQAQKEIEQ